MIIFAIAFFGCCGTCKDNKCMMYTYGILLAVVLIAQVVSALMSHLFQLRLLGLLLICRSEVELPPLP